MLEKFLGLKIKGRCFEQETELKFFPGETQRVSMVFGRNGSGKSTVSRTFAQIAKDGQKDEKMDIVDILDRDHPQAASTSLTFAALKDKTKVFNEDYVREKIIFKGEHTEEGLGTIVMFDEQVSIDTDIQKETANKEKTEAEIKVCSELKEKLEKPDNPNSPDVIKEHIIEDILKNKKLNGWAHREGKILGWNKAQSADESTIAEIMRRTGEDAPDVNLDVFNQNLDRLEQSRKYKNLELPPLSIGMGLGFDETNLLALLNMHVENPNLSERDKRIMAVIAEFGQPWMKEVEAHINKDETTHCPCCQRALNPIEKTCVIESIESALTAALTNEVEDYKTKLRNFVIPNIPSFDIDNYKLIAPELVLSFTQHLGELSALYQRYRQDIDSRLGNIHGAPQFASRGFSEIKEKVTKDLEALKNCRTAFEKAKQQFDTLKSQLQELNYKIAKNEIKKDHARWEQQKKVVSDNNGKLAGLEVKLKASQKEIARLQAQKNSFKIAMDRINQALKYIFLTSNRIQLEVENDVYRIKSNENPVAPQDISVGERNALALCYFFSDMLAKSEKKTAYDTERLIVLDDPVSSFDHENKMGVLSYIMFEIGNLMAGNANTRVICLMHELYSFMALATSINAHDRSVPKERKILQVLLALDCKKKELEDRFGPVDNINEYKRNFQEIFDYAKKKKDELTENIHVGNQARRLLEAFSTFVYRKGVEHLFFGNVIPGTDDDAKKYRKHFEKVFTRFIVNDESHLQGRIRSLGDANNLFPFVDETERQRAVRGAICLIYVILPQHVLSLFDGDVENNEKIIQLWLKDIRDNTPLTEEESAA